MDCTPQTRNEKKSSKKNNKNPRSKTNLDDKEY